MKKLNFLIVLILLSSGLYAQNSMGIGTETPNSNAVLEIVSPNGNQGILIPRYTTAERTATTFTTNLSDTDNGLMVFDTDEGALYFWYSSEWISPSNLTLSDLLSQSTDAGASAITNLANPTDQQDAATKAYVDTLVSNSATWSVSASNLTYSLGNVGIATDSPLSPLQIEDRLNFFEIILTETEIDGRVIADNTYFDGSAIRTVEAGASNFVYLSNDGIEFVHGDSVAAGTDLFDGLETSLQLKNNLNAEFRSAVEIGNLQDSTDMNSGQIAFNGTSFYAFNGVEWRDFAGFGPTSVIDGNLGIGVAAPSANLDVAGTTELNGVTTMNGNVDVYGVHRTNSAVYSAVVEATDSRTVQTDDHIIAITGSSDLSITLPIASESTGRELIILIANLDTALTHLVQVQDQDTIIFEGLSQSAISLNANFDGITMVTLRAVGSSWYVTNYQISANG